MSPILTMENVCVSFASRRVLDKVYFDLRAGEISCLLGPSGCGKTTTLKVVAGLLRPEEGVVRLFNRSVTAATPEQELVGIRKEMGVVFQGGALFDSMTVGQNVAFPLLYCRDVRDPLKIDRAVVDMLQHVELGDIRNMYPAELSGGMRKRVAIARALVHKPSLLLFDEPTTGLDPITARHMDQLVLDLCRKFNVAVLVVTHDLVSALGIADRLLLMEKGRIAWRGAKDEWSGSSSPAVREFAEGMVSIGAGEEVSP